MTTITRRPAQPTRPSVAPPPAPEDTRPERHGSVFVRWITSTDHKIIGYLYLGTSFFYFLLGGVLALVIRAQLFLPGLEVVQTFDQYNQLFTMRGTIMLLLLVPPTFAGWPTRSCRWRSARRMSPHG